MSNKFTPGPWKLIDSIDGEGNEMLMVIKDAEGSFHEICRSYDLSSVDVEETEANLHLIAAVPELLEAAQDVLDCFMEDGETWDDELETPVRESKGFMTRDQKLEKLATAIAKAKGES